MNPHEFASAVKAKYPDYAGEDDVTLARAFVSKFPDYADQVDFDGETPTLGTRVKGAFMSTITPIPVIENIVRPVEEKALQLATAVSPERFIPEGMARDIFSAAYPFSPRAQVKALFDLIPRSKAGIGLTILSAIPAVRAVLGARRMLPKVARALPVMEARAIPAATGIPGITGLSETEAAKAKFFGLFQKSITGTPKPPPFPPPASEAVRAAESVGLKATAIDANASKQLIVDAVGARQAAKAAKQGPVVGAVGKAARAVEETVNEAILKLRAGIKIPRKEVDSTTEYLMRMIADKEISAAEGAKMFGFDVAGPEMRALLAGSIREVSSKFGFGLSQFSRLERELGGLTKALDIMPTDLGPAAKFFDLFSRMENVRRGVMVVRPITTARNIWTQSGRYTLDAIEKGMSAALGLATGKVGAGQALDIATSDIVSLAARFSKSERGRLDAVLARYPTLNAKLLGSTLSESTLDSRMVRFLNTANTYQEVFFRKAVVDARLRQLSAVRKVPIQDLGFKDVQEAVRHGLDLTFASKPQWEFARNLLKVLQNPVQTAIGITYPRFWMNAIRTIYDFSPAPLFAPSTYVRMASSDPVVAFGAMNKAMLGTMTLATGVVANQKGLVGEKWYEVRMPGENKYLDARSFSPFATSLFLGRLAHRAGQVGQDALLEYSADDWSQGLLSMRRAQASGIPILDNFFGSVGGGKPLDKLVRMAGDWLGGFSVPTSIVQDITASISTAEALPRETRAHPILGPLMGNIPFVSQTLPVRPALYQGAPKARKGRLYPGWFGFAVKTKSPTEKEADRLMVSYKNVRPKTGIEELDRVIVGKMGPMIEQRLQPLLLKPGYAGMPDSKKRQVFLAVSALIRKASTEIAKRERPDLALTKLRDGLDTEAKATEALLDEIEKEEAAP